MDKTGDLPGSESPKSPEERDNKRPYTSPISPIEDEGAQVSIPSFWTGLDTNIAVFHTLYTGKTIVF